MCYGLQLCTISLYYSVFNQPPNKEHLVLEMSYSKAQIAIKEELLVKVVS